MEIRSIKIINFRQYKNTNIEFSTDENKKITVIVGNNTSGKTTLVKAFMWGLYRINGFDDKILLNKDVQESMHEGDVKTVRVIIDLEHNGYSYIINTKEDYIKTFADDVKVRNKATTSVSRSTDHESIIIPERLVDQEIQSILSQDLREYFFFDGESNSIETISSKRNLTDAVSDLMGLKSLEILKEYYDPKRTDSITSKFRYKLTSFDETKLEALNQKLSDLQAKLDTYYDDLNNETNGYRITLSSLIEDRDNKEKIISSNLDVKEDQEKKIKLIKDLSRCRDDREDEFNRVILSINQSNTLLKILFAASYVKNDIGQKLDNSTFNSESSLTHVSEELIDQLVERGYCLCGCRILNGSEAYQHLQEEREHMEPRDFGKYASDFCDSEENNVVFAESSFNNIQSLCENTNSLIEHIDQLLLELKAVEKKISGRIDVGEIQKDVIDLNTQINNIQGKIDYIETKVIPNCKLDIESCTKEIYNLTSRTAENEFIQKCIDYCEFLFKIACDKLEKEKQEIKIKLEKVVGEIFNSMYHGNRVIKIDDNFKADAKLIGNKDLDKSKGLETVKNFAFVTGLMKLVKEKIADDLNDEENKDENYPLVLDAPFSNTDDIHIKNICRVLPLYCNQIIIVVMNKDFIAAKTAMEDQIGKFYRIEKVNNSETESIIVEEE